MKEGGESGGLYRQIRPSDVLAILRTHKEGIKGAPQIDLHGKLVLLKCNRINHGAGPYPQLIYRIPTTLVSNLSASTSHRIAQYPRLYKWPRLACPYIYCTALYKAIDISEA